VYGQVTVEYPDGRTQVTPEFRPHEFRTTVRYVNAVLGTAIGEQQMVKLLTKMSLSVKGDEAGNLVVTPSETRSDIFHSVDIAEDVAIAYGYNKIERRLPPATASKGEVPINQVSDLVRHAVVEAGFSKVLNWALVLQEDNYDKLCLPRDDGLAVKVANPQGSEFQMLRTNLLPGALKILSENVGRAPLPLKLFEVGDVTLIDDKVRPHP